MDTHKQQEKETIRIDIVSYEDFIHLSIHLLVHLLEH